MKSLKVLLGLVILGLFACGEEPQDSVPPSIAALSKGVADGWEYAPESQRALLRDGELTFAEYESAVLAAYQCVTGEGIRIRREPSIDKTGWRITFAVYAGSDLAAVGRTAEIQMRCYDEYQNYVEYVWATMNGPTEAEWQEAAEALYDCLAEYDPSPSPAFNSPEFFPWLDSAGLREEFEPCIDTVHAETGVLLGSE
ncbi:MAG TPA: hypothetical protein VFK32_02845 [Tepidiformaceae bacterium]|nr:hypothetical protein [Tepidiformaceae bacterium]